MSSTMHRLSTAALCVSLLIAAPPRAAMATPAARFDFSPVSGCGPNNLEGWEFQTTAAIGVSALGVFDSYADGLQFDVPVGLYDSSCALLASVTIPAGTIAPLHDGYRYAVITPLNLPSGQTFRIAAVMHCDDYTASIQNLDDVSLDAAVSYVRTRRNGFEDMLSCPTDTTSGSYFDFTPNFQIGPPCGNGVVEPGEQCDDANAVDDDCCSLDCKPALAGVPCPDDRLTCTADVCDEAGTCTHAPGNAGAECSPAEDDCHLPDRCDGESEECPELDERKDIGEPCTDDGLFCTGAEVCGEAACMSSGDPCGSAICDEELDQCMTATPTVTRTPVATATRTASPTASASPTGTASATPVATASQTVTRTSSPAATATRTPSATPPASPTGTGSATPGASASHTASATPTATATGAVPSASASRTAAATPSPTAAASPSPTPVASASFTATGTAIATATATPDSATPTVPSGACIGDCGADGAVTIDELIRGVAIALGSRELVDCPAFDRSRNGAVEIDELIAAVNAALGGC